MPGETINDENAPLPFIGPGGQTQKPAEPQGGLAAETMERLVQADRVLTEKRMLPTAKLTDEQIADVRHRLKSYMDKTGATAARVSRETSYSKAVLSEFLAGKYAGDNDKVCRVFNDWIERDARRSTAKRPKDFISTAIAEAIIATVNQADKQCAIGVIVSPSGTGKTIVLKVCAEKLRGIYLYCDARMTAREFLRSLAEALGGFVRTSIQTKSAYQRHVIKTLAGTHRMILLDEAHQLGDEALNCIRSIHDQAEVPFVLAGTADIIRKTDDRSDGRGQFASRCFFYNAVENARDASRPDGSKAARDLFTIEEVRAFLDSKQIRIANDALDLCWSLACLPGEGALRSLDKLMALAFEIKPDVEIVTRPLVRAAMEMKYGTLRAKYLMTLAARHQELSKVA